MTLEPYYETMYILRPDIPEEEVESHVTKYRDMLVEAGAEVLDNQMRGKRRLAYPIDKHKEGIYVQLSHNGDGQHVEVLEKVGKNKLQFPAEDYELTIGITASDGRGSAVSHAETWLLSLRFAPTSSTCYRLAVDSVRDPILYSAGLKFVPFR